MPAHRRRKSSITKHSLGGEIISALAALILLASGVLILTRESGQSHLAVFVGAAFGALGIYGVIIDVLEIRTILRQRRENLSTPSIR